MCTLAIVVVAVPDSLSAKGPGFMHDIAADICDFYICIFHEAIDGNGSVVIVLHWIGIGIGFGAFILSFRGRAPVGYNSLIGSEPESAMSVLQDTFDIIVCQSLGDGIICKYFSFFNSSSSTIKKSKVSLQ